MPSASHLRAQIEATLAERIPSALTPLARLPYPVAPTGIPEIDLLLHGGFPVGALSEVVGPECSGRTSLALAFVGSMTQAGKVCAWVDVSDTLHPESAAAIGVDLSRLLWVRCGSSPSYSALATSPSARIAHGGKTAQGEAGVATRRWRPSPDGGQRPFYRSQRFAQPCSHRSSLRRSAPQTSPPRQATESWSAARKASHSCHQDSPQEQVLGTAGTGTTGYRFTAPGWWLQLHRAGYGQPEGGVCLARAAGDMVSLPCRSRAAAIECVAADPTCLLQEQRRPGASSATGQRACS